MMRVLYVYKDYSPVVGGIENHLRTICTGLSAFPDVQPTVLVTNRANRTVIEEIDGVRVIKAARLANVSSAPISLDLFSWVRRLDADITHLHFPYPIGELAHLLCGHGSKTVITYHSDIVRQKVLLQFYKPFLRRLLARADGITVSNPAYIQSSPYLRPVAAKCRVIPFGVDLDQFTLTPQVQQRAVEIRKRYAHAPLILFAGVLRYYKGVGYLIRAMSQINATLLVVGKGPQGEEWQDLTRQLGLSDKVHFLGRVEDEDMRALFHACDVFVLPSIYRSESLGIVQMEAMSCGKPVVCTELGTGTSFVNLDGETGFVVPPMDPGALASAVNRLLADPDLRARMGLAGRARAEREFAAPVMVRRLVDWYGEVMSGT